MLVPAEQIENCVCDSEGAAKLLAASREGNAPAADFLEMKGQVRSVLGFVQFNLDAFFLERAEVGRASQTRQTDFHRVLIESGSFSQADAPAGKPVREPMIAAEFDPSNGVGWRLVEVQCDGSRVSQGIKGGSGLNATIVVIALILRAMVDLQFPGSAPRRMSV